MGVKGIHRGRERERRGERVQEKRGIQKERGKGDIIIMRAR